MSGRSYVTICDGTCFVYNFWSLFTEHIREILAQEKFQVIMIFRKLSNQTMEKLVG